MYYALILLSVVMFGGCFALNDLYRQKGGSSIKSSLQYSFIGSIAGFAVLMIANGFQFEFTPFTFIMAILASLNGFAFTFKPNKGEFFEKSRNANKTLTFGCYTV